MWKCSAEESFILCSGADAFLMHVSSFPAHMIYKVSVRGTSWIHRALFTISPFPSHLPRVAPLREALMLVTVSHSAPSTAWSCCTHAEGNHSSVQSKVQGLRLLCLSLHPLVLLNNKGISWGSISVSGQLCTPPCVWDQCKVHHRPLCPAQQNTGNRNIMLPCTKSQSFAQIQGTADVPWQQPILIWNVQDSLLLCLQSPVNSHFLMSCYVFLMHLFPSLPKVVLLTSVLTGKGFPPHGPDSGWINGFWTESAHLKLKQIPTESVHFYYCARSA